MKELKLVTGEEIIKKVAALPEMKELKVTLKSVKEVYAGLKKVVADEIGAGNKVQLTGFATIKPQYRAEREAHDIVTKQKSLIPETMGVSIKAGSLLTGSVKKLTPADFKPEAK